MESALPHAKLMYAHVLRWDHRSTDVYCPYCNDAHRHEGTKPEDVHQRRKPIRRAACNIGDMGIRYQLKYPFTTYEIDQSNNYEPGFINRDKDIRIPDSNRLPRLMLPAPSYAIRSHPYKIRGEFPREVVAPTDIDRIVDDFANLKISSGSKRPFTEKQDARRGVRPPVIHIREISGLLDDAGHVRGRVGEISICLEWEQNSDTNVVTTQISILSWEPDDIKIYYILFGTLQPGNINKDSIRKRLKEVRFCLLRRPFISLVDLVARITPVLKAVPVFGNYSYITCLEELLHQEQPPPSILPPHITVTARDTPKWRVYNNHLGHTYAELVHMCPSSTVINRWNLSNEFKTIAGLWREGDFPAVYAISGYGTPCIIDGSDLLRGDIYASLMIDIFDHIGCRFPEDERDQGVPGRYHSCHAELQVLGYLVERHRTVVGLGANWGRLKSIAPSGHLESVVIGVSKRPCDVCHWLCTIRIRSGSRPGSDSSSTFVQLIYFREFMELFTKVN